MASEFPHTYERTILKVEDLYVRFGDNLVLRDIDVEVKDVVRPDRITGQVIALLGPSGKGKTQFFRRLAGLDAPSSGTVRILDEKSGELIPVHPGLVGVVPQSYWIPEDMRVLANVTLPGRQAGMSRDEAEAKGLAYLKSFGLETHANKWPAQLSGGQRQRVAIIRQLMCSGHFLLMDEPFSGLDPIAKDRVSEIVCEVANLDELNTIIIVTHDPASAVAIADTIWLLGQDIVDGKFVPGARIQQTINLIEEGLAWRENIRESVAFSDMVRRIHRDFRNL